MADNAVNGSVFYALQHHNDLGIIVGNPPKHGIYKGPGCFPEELCHRRGFGQLEQRTVWSVIPLPALIKMAERPPIEFRKLRLGYAVQILLKILGKALPVILRVRRSHHIQNLRKPDVLRRSSRKHPVVPTGHPELLPVINGETPLVQFQRDVSGFARGQSDLLESLQLLFGPQVVRRGIFHIQLYNFGTGCITGVGDIQRDAQFPACICLAAQFQIGVSKGRIAQTVSKGKADRNTEAVIIPVSDIDTLPVFHVIAAGSKKLEQGVSSIV